MNKRPTKRQLERRREYECWEQLAEEAADQGTTLFEYLKVHPDKFKPSKRLQTPTNKERVRRAELALEAYEAADAEEEDGDPDMGTVLDRIEDALREEALPLFASDAEAIQAIEDERERKPRRLDLLIKHLKATGGPDAVVGDVMEAAMAEIEKLDEAEQVTQ